MKQVNFKPQVTPEFIARTLGRNIPQLVHADVSTEPTPENLQDILPFSCITIDSRKVTQGSIFVAIQGDNHDGHDFIERAIELGARGIIHRRDFQAPPHADVLFFQVDDTLQAYRAIAAAWRREFSLPVIAVAGSVGKTTTKELLSAALKGKFEHVLSTEGSQNGFVGIPLTLLSLSAQHQIAVIEVGIDDIGAMEQHMALLGATASLLTRIGPEHLERLKDLPTVASEEGIALTSVAKNKGTILINLDDPWIRPYATILRVGRRISFSIENRSSPLEEHVTAEWVDANHEALRFRWLDQPEFEIKLPLPGAHNGSNLAAAVTAALVHGLTPQEIAQGLSSFGGAYGRSEVADLAGSPVVCDYYNANPSSVEAGFNLLDEVARKKSSTTQKWACLGDMLELGAEEEKFHRELSHSILRLSLDGVLLYGERMKWLQDELKKKDFKGHVSHHASHEELVAELNQRWHPGDALLIKGSRGTKMETVWKALQAKA